ncbi:GTP-ase activating domain containing protein, putative [Babesia bigemina]|uniref:GTP-ase activating domain containing protein, putative n=1 Tax=Babesia bigemina TaxID=5866 RepID=A0A061DB67_BABBI|nr:GTP-ase activating domain containing protein, putative [Babesia bigemina]CDR97778.1 GTP-ase activating domain containing protein, putative [Babesia bigemina]|eukprot:XP_012769964.1 GTP-ase activating domain containing protein, putative [Babesia bigemina]
MFGSPIAGRICSIEGNNICADCGGRSPRWASVNLGVLLCINCSGVHRMLGVHVSQVKSLTLDNLKPEWIKVLTNVGNEIANSYYLHKLPSHAPRPHANTSAKDMEIWIRNKYERKIYAMDGVEEPYILLAKGYNPREIIAKGTLGPAARPQSQPATQEPANTAMGGSIKGFGGPEVPVCSSTSEDLFGNANAHGNAVFQDSAPQANWSGDFWPTSTPSKGRKASFDNDLIGTVPSSVSFESNKVAETKIEAAKDSISKLFDNPSQIGFKNSSYEQKTPNCVQGDLFDFNFSDLGNKLQSQQKQNDDLI